MNDFTPLRNLPLPAQYKPGDVLVIFGELFQKGYVNGLIDEAKKNSLKIIYSTVGRRDGDGNLQPLNQEELQEKQMPLINIPLEAGFDMQPDDHGITPCYQLKGIKLKEWESTQLNWDSIEQAKAHGINDFTQRLNSYIEQLLPMIPETANVLFAHTMAGGFPRAKVVMPAANRVFKGVGDRYYSSERFWQTDIGRLCKINFDEVTGNTLKHLIDLSQPIREKVARNNKHVSYVAYGYHGTEVLINNKYQWQFYSPYLQG